MNAILAQKKMLGIVFLALLVTGVYLTYAVFTKQFTAYDRVTLQTSSIGLQLPQRADIKIRGVLVGEVLDFEPDANGAEITLGIYPDEIDQIPGNVSGSIVPKTLFGEKYVALVVPDAPSGTLAAGDVIDRTEMATEVEQVLADLQPLLTAVQPADINMTLNAFATALEGRGDQVGENLETLDAYLKRINPRVPELVEDLRLTGQVADVYDEILPEVANILDNTVITTSTLEEKEERLKTLFQDVAMLADTTKDFLRDNEETIVRFNDISAQQLRVISRYSTEFPCLTRGLVKAGRLQAEAFRNFKLHIVLETLPRQPRAYDANDTPVIGEDRGPTCLTLPNPPWSQDNINKRVPNFNDGVNRPTGKGTSRVATNYVFRDGAAAGNSDELATLRYVLGPALGIPAADVDDLGPLLLAPMARGAKVGVE